MPRDRHRDLEPRTHSIVFLYLALGPGSITLYFYKGCYYGQLMVMATMSIAFPGHYSNSSLLSNAFLMEFYINHAIEYDVYKPVNNSYFACLQSFAFVEVLFLS